MEYKLVADCAWEDKVEEIGVVWCDRLRPLGVLAKELGAVDCDCAGPSEARRPSGVADALTANTPPAAITI